MQFSSTAQNPRTQQIALLLVVVVLFLPFADKAYHIDDPVYIWVARQILSKPLDFFGFSANWYMEVEPGSVISVSPPLFSYYLALPGSLFNWAEIPLHVAAIIPSMAVALGTYRLAGCLKSAPFISALLAVCTPVFLLCGTSVMVDMAMTALYVWAVYFWISGLESSAGGNYRMTVAALCVVAAGLTKYFAISLVPLLVVYPLWRRVPVRRWLPFLTGPMVVFAFYQLWTRQLYGVGHITHASQYAASYKEWVQISTIKSLVDGLSFTGGGILLPVVFAPLLLSRRTWLPLLAGVIALGGLLKATGMYAAPDGGLFYCQLAIFVAAGVYVLVTAVVTFLRDRDAGSLLLLCWVTGVFLYCSLLNPVVAGRYILPLVPAVTIIMGKRPPRYGEGWRRAACVAGFVLLILTALLVTYADYRYANDVRSIAGKVLAFRAQTGKKLYFQGHWGLQYYLEAGGGTALSQQEPQAQTGDLLVTPSFGSNVSELNQEYFTLLEWFSIQPTRWVSTFNNGIGAGFHCSLYGPLPYAFGEVRQDYFYIHEVGNTPLPD